MKTHLNDGELRAALDGELDAARLQHLETCGDCQMRQRELQVQSQQTIHKLSFLAPTPEDSAPSARSAWNRIADRLSTPKEIPMFKKLFTSPLVRFAAVALLLLVLIFSFSGTRALAGELLNLFRVQQVTVIPVDFTGLDQLTGGATGKQFSELISSSIEMTQKPGEPVVVADAAQASQKAGFTVRLPQNQTLSQIYVTGPAAFNVVVDRAKAQALLDEAGRSDLTLPASIDGARISANIPASVSIAYGKCPKPQEDKANGDNSQISGRLYPDCVILAEVPSPIVDAPPDLNIQQLAQIALEFTGMTSEEAAAFSNTVDWTSTLVVPIPKNAATYEQVNVDGVTGTLIQRPANDAPQYALLWVKDGIIYAISGLGTNSPQAVEMANSLP